MTKPIHTPTELDWISSLYYRIAKVTTRYAFVAPVEQADLERFEDLLAAALPSGCTPTVARYGDYVRVDVRHRTRLWYRRDMIIQCIAHATPPV